jgi:hypothetical protein
MIVYLLPTVLPFCSLFSGVISVFVTDIPSADFKDVAHSLQNLESDVFSVLHSGHLIPKAYPLSGRQNIIKEHG